MEFICHSLLLFTPVLLLLWHVKYKLDKRVHWSPEGHPVPVVNHVPGYGHLVPGSLVITGGWDPIGAPGSTQRHQGDSLPSTSTSYTVLMLAIVSFWKGALNTHTAYTYLHVNYCTLFTVYYLLCWIQACPKTRAFRSYQFFFFVVLITNGNIKSMTWSGLALNRHNFITILRFPLIFSMWLTFPTPNQR